MKNVAKLFLMVCMFCPVLSAEPNQTSGRAAFDSNAIKRQDLQQTDRRQQRLKRRMSHVRADANQQAIGGREFVGRQQAREKQIGGEYLKNKKRIAALTRIKELAEATNQPEKAQKAESLIQMENQRHRKKIIRLQVMSAIPANISEKADPNKK